MAAASSRLPALFLLFCLYYCSMSPIHVRSAGPLSLDFNLSHHGANLSRCFYFRNGAASISGSPSMLEFTPSKPELAIHAAALSFNCSCSDYPALSRHDTSSLATNSTVCICSVLASGLCFSRALSHGPDVGSSAICRGSSTITRHVILTTDVDSSIEASLREKQLPNRSTGFSRDVFFCERILDTMPLVSSGRSGIDLGSSFRACIGSGSSFRACIGSATNLFDSPIFPLSRDANGPNVHSAGSASSFEFIRTGSATGSRSSAVTAGRQRVGPVACSAPIPPRVSGGNSSAVTAEDPHPPRPYSATTRRLLSGTYGRSATKRHLATRWHGAYTSSMEQTTVVRAGIAGSALLVLICTVAGLLLCCIRTKKPRQRAAAVERGDDEPIIREPELIRRGLGPRLFRYSELAAVTRGFAEDMKIGRGGFGPVYRGQLTDQDRRHVAIKLLSEDQSVQGLKEFQAEVTIISQLRHRNIVQLVGWCVSRRGLALVYELMQGGSLDTHLYNPERHLTWSQRYRIALGLGSALHYLHIECDRCIVHGDIKPANVMLDASRRAKLGDFGLARLVDHGSEPQTTRVVAGTVGYIDPELVNSRRPSTESDVYSFGVVLLEIVCGRRPTSRQPDQAAALLTWVRDMHDRNLILDVADQRLDAEFDRLQMERLLVTGLWCAHHDPTQRPSIAQAMDVLRSDDSKLPVLPVMPGSGEIRSLEGRAYDDLSAENSTYFSTTTACLTTED